MKRTILLILLACLPIGLPALEAGEIERLRKDLRHFDFKVRMQTIDALSALGDEKAEVAIRSALSDEDWAVQIRALEALGRMGAKDSAEAIARALVEG